VVWTDELKNPLLIILCQGSFPCDTNLLWMSVKSFQKIEFYSIYFIVTLSFRIMKETVRTCVKLSIRVSLKKKMNMRNLYIYCTTKFGWNQMISSFFWYFVFQNFVF